MTPAISCGLCGGECAGADLDALTRPDLAWVWEAVADAADRRGDPFMTTGPRVSVTAPADPAARAAAAGLFTGALSPGQVKRLDLANLTVVTRARGDALTPGAVAAHATGRVLAVRAAAHAARAARAVTLKDALSRACDHDPLLSGRSDDLHEHLRRTGWVARLDGGADTPDVIAQAVTVTARVLRIPRGERFDKRLLVPEDPHTLDDGEPLTGVVLALLTGHGIISPDPRASTRAAWSQAGVDCDDIIGGLPVLGVQPAGWSVPVGVTCTVPPRELARCDWPPPPTFGSWVFVTENPSVLAAAADMVRRHPSAGQNARLICTMGTPSRTEIEAIDRLAKAGWRVAVRADFDLAGIRHVTALLNGVMRSVPWRMGASDYLESLAGTAAARLDVPSAPWDPALAAAMSSHGVPAYEESILSHLLTDLRRGHPPEK